MTLKEVAVALRVSPMTVSNAYNRPDRIAPATRARVLSEAARLGYPGPHPLARHLRTGRAGAVGILYSSPLSYAFSDPAAVLFLQGVSQATEAARLGLLLLSGATVDLSGVAGAAVDGLIVQALAEDDPLLHAALGRRLPLILVDQPALPGLPAVGIDDAGGARAAAEHLLALGHRRLGIIALGRGRDGPFDAERLDTLSNPVACARLRGYAAALAEAAVPWFGVPIYTCATLTLADGARAAHWLLGQVPRPTALLAMSDQYALGALDAARTLGLNVPGDLSVVGFDDVPGAARAEPALTTISQPHLLKGQRAAQLLVALLQGAGERAPTAVFLPTEIVVRASTARPRA
jgi:DNA-binding LacI/PurR family transcriptional regulator